VVAVETAIAAGLHQRAHPPALPDNIYGTDGEWEEYSTPSRDARLKAAVRELHDSVAQVVGAGAAQAEAAAVGFRAATRQGDCQFRYVRSDRSGVALSFDEVLDRLFTMSFDPYHCPELRWGAPSGPERSTCPDGAGKLEWYTSEQRLRNRIDREYGAPTPLDSGPEVAPDVDPRHLFPLVTAANPKPAPRQP